MAYLGFGICYFRRLGILFHLHGMHNFATFCACFVTAMLPYIMLDLGFPFGKRFKVFMGDAAVFFIGFTVSWLLIVASQGDRVTAIRCVTALWLIALPLMDMVCIMIRRIRKDNRRSNQTESICIIFVNAWGCPPAFPYWLFAVQQALWLQLVYGQSSLK